MLDFVKTQKEALEVITEEMDQEAVSQYIRSHLMKMFEVLKNDLFKDNDLLSSLLDVVEFHSTPSQQEEVKSLREELQSES